MGGTRIPGLTSLTGADSATDDDLVIFDTSADMTKRITREELALGLAGDLGGATGTFTTTDGKTVTVTAGLITAIV